MEDKIKEALDLTFKIPGAIFYLNQECNTVSVYKIVNNDFVFIYSGYGDDLAEGTNKDLDTLISNLKKHI